MQFVFIPTAYVRNISIKKQKESLFSSMDYDIYFTGLNYKLLVEMQEIVRLYFVWISPYS